MQLIMQTSDKIAKSLLATHSFPFSVVFLNPKNLLSLFLFYFSKNFSTGNFAEL